MKIKKIFMGSIIEIIPTIIIALIEIIKIKVFVDFLGSEMNGYYQFINQIIGYLFLVEAGLSSAVVYKMYKPVAEKNSKKINELYSGSIIIFKRIAIIMFIILISMAFIFPFIINGNIEELIIVISSFILIGFANILSFIMYSRSLQAVFYANEEKYILATTLNIIKIITGVITIFLIISFKSLFIVALALFLMKIVEEISVWLVAKYRYKYIKKVKKVDTSAMSMTKDLIWHQVGTLSANNVDTLVLMILKGPIIVSIYSTYNYIYRFLVDLIAKITSNVSNTFGILFVKESEERMFKLYKDYLFFCFLIATLVSLNFMTGARSFINIWIGKDQYILEFVSIFFFSSALFINIIYSPLITIVQVKGLFKETKYYALISSAINFVLSFILAIFYGITGVLIATAFASFVSVFLRTSLISKIIFKGESKFKMLFEYFKRYLIFIVFGLLSLNIEKAVFAHVTGYFSWIIYMGIYFLITTIIVFIIGYYRNDYFRKLIKLIFNKLRRYKI